MTGPQRQCSESSLQTSLNTEEIKSNLRFQEAQQQSEGRNYGCPVQSVIENTETDISKFEDINRSNEAIIKGPNPPSTTRHSRDDPNTPLEEPSNVEIKDSDQIVSNTPLDLFFDLLYWISTRI